MKSEITNNGRTWSGPQAMHTMQAVFLRSSLALYETTGIIPTRGFGLKRMMGLASQLTDKHFPATKRSIHEALAALDLLIEASKAALTVTTEGSAE